MTKYPPAITVKGKQATIQGLGSFEVPSAPNIQPGRQHPLLAGTISDSNWVTEELTPYYDAMTQELKALESAASSTKSSRFNEYRPEVAQFKRAQTVLPALEAIEAKMKAEAERLDTLVSFSQRIRDEAAAIAPPKSDLEAFQRTFEAREIRDAVADMTPRERAAFVEKARERGDRFSLLALEDSPRDLFPASELDPTNPQRVKRALESVVDAEYPWAKAAHDRNLHVQHAVGVRNQELWSLVRQVLNKYGLDEGKVKQAKKGAPNGQKSV